jgi:hypothetical protein
VRSPATRVAWCSRRWMRRQPPAHQALSRGCRSDHQYAGRSADGSRARSMKASCPEMTQVLDGAAAPGRPAERHWNGGTGWSQAVPTEPAEEPLPPRTTRRRAYDAIAGETSRPPSAEYDGDARILRPAAVAGLAGLLARLGTACPPPRSGCRRCCSHGRDMTRQLAVADLDVSGDTSGGVRPASRVLPSRPVGQGPGSPAACSTSSRSRGGVPRVSRAPPLTGLLY